MKKEIERLKKLNALIELLDEIIYTDLGKANNATERIVLSKIEKKIKIYN